MKTRMKKPWMKSNGKPLADAELKLISKSWDAGTWEEYLRWYESPRQESLVSPTVYDMLCDSRSTSIYEEFGYETDPKLRAYCDRLLSSLPGIEEKVLRLYFFEGLTELEIANQLKRSQCGIHLIKKRAISRLQRQTSAGDLIALRIMRGLDSQKEVEFPSPWENVGPNPVREEKASQPENWRAELQLIGNAPVREAIQQLSDDQKQIVYRRFWCEQPISLIARKLGIGVNVAQEILDAAVFKIKGRVALEMNPEMEVLSCA